MKSNPDFPPNRFKHLFRALATYAVAALFVGQIAIATPTVLSTLSGPLQDPNPSYEEKMRGAWGSYFDFMQFVQAKTSENAVLLFDPKYFYATLSLYFLYPRKLIYGGKETWQSHPEVDYVVISEGYPSFSVQGEKEMFDDKQGVYRVQR
jgi:hypothetical protein